MKEGGIMTGGWQTFLDGGIMPPGGGRATYFWRAAFINGDIIPSRGGMILLECGITSSEGGRILWVKCNASVGACQQEGEGDIS